MDQSQSSKTCEHIDKQQEYFINIQGNAEKVIVCPQCVIEFNYQGQYLLYSQQIKSSNDETIFINWPPLNNMNLCKKVQDHLKQQQKADYSSMRSNTIQFFQDFKKDLVTLIDSYQKNIMIKIDQMENYRNELVCLYNNISQKEEIKNIIKMDIEMQSVKFGEILNSLMEKKEQNTKQLEEFINGQEKAQHVTNLENAKKIRKNFLAIAEQYICQGIYEIKESFQNIEQNSSKCKSQLFQLLSIPSNYITQEYQQSILNKLDILPITFFDVNNINAFVNNSNPLKVSNIKIFEELDKAISQNQEKLFYSINLAMEKDKLQSLKVEEIKIFEFIRAQCYNDPNNSLIKHNQVTRLTRNDYIMLLSKLILQKNYKYKLVFSVSSNFLLVIGIIPKANQSSQTSFFTQNFSYSTQKSWFKLNQIKKGENLVDKYTNPSQQQFLLEICLDQKLFQVSDYPDKNSINCLSQDQVHFFEQNIQEEPRISFHICHANGGKVGDTLRIHDFQIEIL
ncbi:hypothetical protein TTHERM_00300530 (macronuclear) [Tetrahymena thermophila SB210]|uniref:Zinc carboxypeptidase family protein n=1 Tax=Tetrahymena thermophila (strain SB210) TaxID=312017 RepID=I7MM81_TETTS|nr:hypothetical protein TTHERM_00300530 [Tetrahymena thermophila SB210]EAS04335.1 hypothetical protein TTHERM_00300530 [Tetrahymena thermophila SB210]|eukprot:XP_001024580.1 hypothetical protein TTHERM_00300530 [Tetrahymena thermophila SB210]